MNGKKIVLALATAVALAFAATAFAQTQTPSAQGVPGGVGSPTPGTVNPQATDPSTATPSTVSPPAGGQRSSVDPSASAEPRPAGVESGSVRPNVDPSASAEPRPAGVESGSVRPNVDPTERSRAAAGNSRLAAAGNVSAGMPVQSTSGEPLGAVRDVVPRPSGDPGYVVITLPKGGKTAVPYAAATSMLRNGTIVVDRAQLEGAPRVQDSQLQDHSDQGWEKQADRYWSRGGSTPSEQPGQGQRDSSGHDRG
jgi:hypothetical protein